MRIDVNVILSEKRKKKMEKQIDADCLKYMNLKNEFLQIKDRIRNSESKVQTLYKKEREIFYTEISIFDDSNGKEIIEWFSGVIYNPKKHKVKNHYIGLAFFRLKNEIDEIRNKWINYLTC